MIIQKSKSCTSSPTKSIRHMACRYPGISDSSICCSNQIDTCSSIDEAPHCWIGLVPSLIISFVCYRSLRKILKNGFERTHEQTATDKTAKLPTRVHVPYEDESTAFAEVDTSTHSYCDCIKKR